MISLQVRNATAVFIINLSLSDLLFCCFNLPLAASTFWYRAWTHGDLLCRLYPLLRYGLLAVSLFTVLAITINRYVMIGHPRIYPRLVSKYIIWSACVTRMYAEKRVGSHFNLSARPYRRVVRRKNLFFCHLWNRMNVQRGVSHVISLMNLPIWVNSMCASSSVTREHEAHKQWDQGIYYHKHDVLVDDVFRYYFNRDDERQNIISSRKLSQFEYLLHFIYSFPYQMPYTNCNVWLTCCVGTISWWKSHTHTPFQIISQF